MVKPFIMLPMMQSVIHWIMIFSRKSNFRTKSFSYRGSKTYCRFYIRNLADSSVLRRKYPYHSGFYYPISENIWIPDQQ